jgi:hypothetical protein
MCIAANHRNAPIALWRVASRLMITLFNLFGEPQELAFRHTLIARDYKLACNWLRTVEALFRKLLFIEASYYVTDAAPAKPRAKRKRVRCEMAFYPEKPDEWRVTFRALDRRRPRRHGATLQLTPAPVRSSAAGEDAGGPSTAPHLAPTRFHSAWPLAERFEALLRVHNDPAPYAKRLARRLNAESASAILKAPAELEHRIDPEPYAQIEAMCAERREALPCVPLNSS